MRSSGSWSGRLAIETGKRFVHQQHARPRRDRARERDALLLAARQHMRIDVGEMREADAREREARFALGIRLRQRLQTEHDIGEIGQVRKQREVLEHQSDAAAFRRQIKLVAGDFAVVDQDASRCRLLDAGREPQQRGLAATGAAEQTHDLARPDIETEIADRDHVAVAMRDVLVGETRGDRGRRASARAASDCGGIAVAARQNLILGGLRTRREPEIEIAGFQRIFVVAQRRIVRR